MLNRGSANGSHWYQVGTSKSVESSEPDISF
jgi:hypothetical protein